MEGYTAIPKNIPKTIIFFNTRQNALNVQAKMVDYLYYLYLVYTKEKARALILIFYWNILLYLKRDILREFKKKFFKITLIFVTEAIGFSINISTFVRWLFINYYFFTLILLLFSNVVVVLVVMARKLKLSFSLSTGCLVREI